MRSLCFLSMDDVLHLHASTIAVEGGASGLRDLALLESAVAMPSQQFGGVYLHGDLAAMAAAYLFHLCCNHAFIDGNKRVATLAALAFLAANGKRLTATNDELIATVLAVASSEMTKAQLTTWLRAHVKQCV